MRLRLIPALYSAAAVLILLYGCNSSSKSNKQVSNNDRSNIGKWKLVADDVVKIPVEGTGANTTYVPIDYFQNNDSGFIAVTDQQNFNLNIYNITGKYLSKKIHFAAEGPNGIGNYYVADFKNFDSILVRGNHHHKLFLLDSAARLKHTFELNFSGANQRRVLLFAPNNKPMFLNGAIYGTLNLNIKGDRFVMSDLPVYRLDLNDTVPQLVRAITFPPVLRDEDDIWPLFVYEPSMCAYKDNLVYTFPMADSVYVYNTITQKVRAFKVPNVEGYELPTSLDDTAIPSLVKLAKYAYLNYLLRYDPYQDVFYRFVFNPVETDEKYMDYYSAMLDKPITVQILDPVDFSVKGETKLKSKSYYFRDFFIGKDGLYLSNNHSANPENSEKFLSYTRFKIEKS